MSIIQYQPEPGSAAWRVCSFFSINSDEMLTTADIARKFEIPRGSITGQLQGAVAAELLRTLRDEGTFYYAAGASIGLFQREASAPSDGTGSKHDPAASAFPRTRRGLRINHLPPIDPASIVVRDNVPMPATVFNQRGQGKYTRLFEMLADVGQSFPVPVVYRAALTKAAEAYSKATGRKLQVRTIDAATCGVWRTK